jgi:broad specificity polyphosphatase/5'/3'-nucleotidase SurE
MSQTVAALINAVLAGIEAISAAMSSGSAADRSFRRISTALTRIARTVVQKDAVMKVNGYGSKSMNRFGCHQSQYVRPAKKSGASVQPTEVALDVLIHRAKRDM